MRYTTTLFFAVIVSGTFQMCNDDVHPEPGKVQFTLSKDAIQTNSSTPAEQLNALQVSIESSNGTKIYSNRHLQLTESSDGYVSQPLELPAGTYLVTDVSFPGIETQLITLAGGNQGAKTGQASLPVKFVVSDNQVSNVKMEVARTRAPQDAIIQKDFAITVYSEDGESPAQAEAFILSGTDTLQSYVLSSSVNKLSFTENTDDTFTLLIGKDGYRPYSRKFIFSQLKQELQDEPLTVQLEPAFTIVAYGSEFQVSITGNQTGEINVDWGDGTQETYAISQDFTDIAHTYSDGGNHFVSITGSLDKITQFYSYYGYGPMDRINLEQLTELNDLRIGITRSPRSIDLRKNTKIATIDLAGCEQLETVLLGDNQIIALTLDGPNNISTASIDDIIGKLHRSVTTQGRQYGSLGLSAGWGTGTNEMVGPPSPATLSMISDLKNGYGWSVYPEPLPM